MDITYLRERKEKLGYTNEKISALSGVPLSTVNKIFGGFTSRPRLNTLQSIECALFPEKHSSYEAAMYKDIVHNLTLDYAGRVEESPMFDEYKYLSSEFSKEQGSKVEKVLSWKHQGEYTIDDWRSIPDGLMAELINGTIYDRNTPSKKHQFIVTRLAAQLDAAIESRGGADCLVLTAPTGVQLDPEDNKNGFIPDVIVVCDREKYSGGEEEIIGAPDFVAEVLSPSTEKYDTTIKLEKYWDAGVREYWIIDIEQKRVFAYAMGDCTIINKYSFDDQIPLAIADGEVVIDFKSINERMKNYFGD